MRALPWTDLDAAFAQAYYDAARSGADMRAAAGALESVRDLLRSGPDTFAVWASFDEQIGRADDRLAPTLVRLRGEFELAALEAAVGRLEQAFARDPREGWRAWLGLYVGTFDERGFRRGFGAELARRALSWSPSEEWPVERIRRVVSYVLRSRWADACDWFLFLANRQELSGRQRATALCVVAEIELYHFVRLSRARELLRQAVELAPDQPGVLRCWGEYWLAREELEQARECFSRLVQMRSDLADGFVGLGDCADKTGDVTAAESYYNQAVVNAPGMRDGYRQLLNWHGKQQWFANREALVESFFARLLRLSDYQPYTWVELGCVYKQNRRYENARRCFSKALELDPDCSLARVWLGYTHFDDAVSAGLDTPRGAELLETARTDFEQTVRFAAEALDGYWAMSGLEMARGDWQAALEWCGRGLRCHPGWEPSVRLRRAHILRQLGRTAEALDDASRSVALEPYSPSAPEILADLAGSFLDAGDQESFARVVEAGDRLEGNALKASFRNRIGNLYYKAADYSAAARCYRQAIEATPCDDVLHSNLALALERRREPGRRLEELTEAAAALSRALNLSPDNAAYRARLSDLEAEFRFVQTYGEDALKLEPFVTPIRVEVAEDVLPDLLNPALEALSEATLRRIGALRARLRERFGITIPGVRFGVLGEAGVSKGAYVIRILERHVYAGEVEPGGSFVPAPVPGSEAEPPKGVWRKRGEAMEAAWEIWDVADYLLAHLGNVVQHHLAEFVGHQEASEMLKGCQSDGARWILNAPGELTRFVRTIRLLLERKIAVAAMERIAGEFFVTRQSGADPEAIAARIAALPGAPPAAASGLSPMTV